MQEKIQTFPVFKGGAALLAGFYAFFVGLFVAQFLCPG
jgi:hypothetical protein